MVFLFHLAFACAAFAGGEDDRPTDAEKAAFAAAFDKLGSDSYAERKAAAEKIRALGSTVLGLLEERRKHPDPETRNAVERAIKEIRHEAARRRIVELIESTGVSDDPDEIFKKFASPNEEDRLDAFLRLTVRHTQASIPIVREFLDDPSGKVADAAITELKNLINEKNAGIAGQVIKLIAGTPTDEEVIIYRIDAFLHFADFRNESLVEKLKNLENEKAREMIFTRMVLVPEENFVFAFASMLGNPDRFMRRYCAGGVEVVIREVLRGEGRWHFTFEEKERKRLAQMMAAHLESEDPVVVHVTAGAVGYAGIDCCADKLAALLASEDVRTARRAAFSIGLTHASGATGALLEALKEGRYEILPEACDSLARIGDPGTFKPLLELFSKKSVPFRELVLHAMTRVDLKRSAQKLPEVLSDENVAVRSLAVDRLVSAFGVFPEISSSMLPELMKIMKEGAQEAKFAAARVVGEVGGMSVLPELKSMSAGSDPLVRAASFMPIVMISGEGAKGLLEKSTSDPDYQVRVRAAQALGYLGDWSSFIKIRLVPVEIKGDSVTDAMKRIAWAAGINLVLDPGAVRMCSLDNCVIEVRMKDKTLLEALKMLKKSFGIAWDVSHHALFVTVESREKILDSFKVPAARVGCSEKDLLIEKKLCERVTADAVSEEMSEFFNGIGGETDIKFQFDQSAFACLDESLQTVDMSLSDVPLAELLGLVLGPRGLKAAIEDGAILISADR